MVDILTFLKGSDTPADDQKLFLKAQILFRLIGATDGHAKSFSVFLRPRGSFSITPLYDVLTAQPSLAERQIERKQMRLAMSVGDNRHYRIDQITGHHFVQTSTRARLPKRLIYAAISEIADTAGTAIDRVETMLPKNFPEAIHVSVKTAMEQRLNNLALTAQISGT